jgi:hypothetical protein
VVMLILLMNNIFLISEIEEVVADIGRPDCKLTNPYLITGNEITEPWLAEYTDDLDIMISSDKILTLIQPKQTFLDKYLELTQ